MFITLKLSVCKCEKYPILGKCILCVQYFCACTWYLIDELVGKECVY